MSLLQHPYMKLNLYHRLLWKVLLLLFVFGIYYYYYYYHHNQGTVPMMDDTQPDMMKISQQQQQQRYEVCPIGEGGGEGGTICPIDNVCCGHLCLSGGTIDDTTDHHHQHHQHPTNMTNTNATCCTDVTNHIHHSNTTPVMTTLSSSSSSSSLSTTGCGVNYMCSTTNISMCTVIHPMEHNDIPIHVPRTKLCHFTNAMTHIYAMPMMTNHHETVIEKDPDENILRRRRDRSDPHPPVQRVVPMATYLSTMGPIHEDLDDDDTNSNIVSFENITRVIILIHGSRRNVEDYLCCVNAAIPTSDDESSYVDPDAILILAPWFPTEEDGNINITSTKSQQHPRNNNHTIIDQFDILRWIGNNDDPFSINHIFHTWRYGAGAINNPNISSYDVVDQMIIQYLYNRTKFPNVQHIIVTGHSAGGQYVQRWALLSNSIHDDHDDIDNDDDNVESYHNQRNVDENNSTASSRSSSKTKYPVVFTVVANPKSYAHLDPRRWMNTTRNDTSSSIPNALEFRIPTDQEISNCLTYNDWEWGFDHRSNGNELVAPYVSKAITTAGGMEVVVQRYAQRNVIYLSGEEDILYNGDCNDRIQGPNRRIRSERYFQAIQQYYPSTHTSINTSTTTHLNHPSHKHHRYIIPNVPHNHCLMYQSRQGQQALFGMIQ